MQNQIVNSKSRSEWELLIMEWIHNEKDRCMLKRRLLDGLTFDELADEFSPLTVDRIKQRIYKAQTQLFKHI